MKYVSGWYQYSQLETYSNLYYDHTFLEREIYQVQINISVQTMQTSFLLHFIFSFRSNARAFN